MLVLIPRDHAHTHTPLVDSPRATASSHAQLLTANMAVVLLLGFFQFAPRQNFFLDVHMATGGHLDILVNNAFSGIGYWNEHASLGKPFWDTGMGLYDAVHTVGVRSHFKATILAMPLLKRALNRGLIVNTNSPGCLL